MDETRTEADLAGMTTDIVTAYVSNNAVAPEELASLITSVHAALAGMPSGAEPEPEPQAPAVPIRKSITPDYIISLEDGSRYKSLKRHLATKYGMSPEDYRAKWRLPPDYPMVAPNYAKARSELAKSMGLGQGGRKPAKKTRRSGPEQIAVSDGPRR
ncbi:MAG: putative transcriptional regulator [Brevundimonas sp.]|jgi:predicted transcriptional regulator|uniref:MucR family transcriptional regulator n=1 Tax=Brevundimonas sp. TaxID=1871086 RepID=UPI0039E45207